LGRIDPEGRKSAVEHLADLLELVRDFPGISFAGVGIHREMWAPHFNPVVRSVGGNWTQQEQGSNRDRPEGICSEGHSVQDVNDCGATVKAVSSWWLMGGCFDLLLLAGSLRIAWPVTLLQ
jgi:hypothetical protein